MQTTQVTAHIGEDGILRLALPTPLTNVQVEVVVVYHASDQSQPCDDSWQAFVDSTYGCLADDPLERPAALPEDTRESME